jgi:hypothetical protein
MPYTESELRTELYLLAPNAYNASRRAGCELPRIMRDVFEAAFLRFLAGDININEDTKIMLLEAYTDLQSTGLKFVK